MGPETQHNPLRELPQVDTLLGDTAFSGLIEAFGRQLVTEGIRGDLGWARETIRGEATVDTSPAACAARVEARLGALMQPRYGRAINGTGVVLHTGLGRAPLPRAAREALAEVSRSFAVLEIERDSGRRGKRDHEISELLTELTGAEAATVVNNNAGATLITLAALAAERSVIVSRGQLVEIGGSFRIPDVMALSGAKLVEVGTTNRTHLADYERALDKHPDVACLLRVHTSNFQVVGFTKEVSLPELVALGRERGVPVMDDLGSGCLIDLALLGLTKEPVVQESLSEGAAVVTFSGDKLLGGPQAGLIVGQRDAVELIRKHPLYRALRPDKLTLAALEATLALYRDPNRALDEIPTLRMLTPALEELKRRAKALADQVNAQAPGLRATVQASSSRIGGGSYAVEELPTRVVAIECEAMRPDELARLLRQGSPAVFVRIQDDRLLIDSRTLLGPEEDAEVLAALLRCSQIG